jgi:glycosyltransferase involved in cell wall biosynthesis
MKISYVLSSFFPDHRAGTETYVLNLSQELVKLGHQVSIIIPAIGKDSFTYDYEGIKVFAYNVPLKINTKELNGLEKPSGIEEFKSILLEIKPDILHLQSLGRSMHSEHIKIASELGIKTFFTAHLGGNFCTRGDLLVFGKHQCNGIVKKNRCLACFINKQRNISIFFSKLLSLLINTFLIHRPIIYIFPAYHIVRNKLIQLKTLRQYCSFNIAIAEWLKNIYLINGLTKTVIIKQGIILHLKDKKDSKNKERKKIEIIFVGRMHPLKNIDLVLNSIKEYIEFFNLTIITIPFDYEIEYYKKIRTCFFNLNFSSWFENLTNQLVSEKISEADILILPSKFEAAPLVILEAFAQKIPVIASDYIAMKEMVKHDVNGLLFKNGSALSLKEQLLRLVNEPELLSRLKQNIGPVHTFKDVAREHDVIYNKLME